MNEEQLYQQFLNNGGDASFEDFVTMMPQFNINVSDTSKKKVDTPITTENSLGLDDNTDINKSNPENPQNNLNTSLPQEVAMPISNDLDLNQNQIQTLENTTIPSVDISNGIQQNSLSDSNLPTQNALSDSSEFKQYIKGLSEYHNYDAEKGIFSNKKRVVPQEDIDRMFAFYDARDNKVAEAKAQIQQHNLDLLAGTSNENTTQLDLNQILGGLTASDLSPEDKAFFEKYGLEDYKKTDVKPIPLFTKESIIGSDDIDLAGGKVASVQDWNTNVMNLANQGKVKLLDEMQTTPNGRILYQYVDDNLLQQANDEVEKLNNATLKQFGEDNIDAARHNYNARTKELPQDTASSFSNTLYSLTGVLPTQDELSKAITEEDRNQMLANADAQKVAKDTGVSFDQAYNEVKGKYLISDESKYNAGYNFFKDVLIPQMQREANDENNGLFANGSKEEYENYKNFFSNENNIQAFGEYLLKKGLAENLSSIKEMDFIHQKSRRNLFADFYAYQQDKENTNIKFTKDALNNVNAKLKGAVNNPELVNQYNTERNNLIENYNQSINNFNTINDSAAITLGSYTKYNADEKAKQDFYINKENGDFGSGASNFIGQIPLGIASSVTNAITGIGRIVNSVIPSDNLKDALDIISNTELRIGNVTIANLSEKVETRKGEDGKSRQYKNVNGQWYVYDNNGKIVKTTEPKGELISTSNNYNASGLMFLTAKMGADVVLTRATGGGINKATNATINRVASVFGAESNVAKYASSFSKVLNNADNASVSGWYVQMYNDSYLMAERGGISSAQGKHLYAITQSFIQSIIQKINPDTNFLKSINDSNRMIVSSLMNNNLQKAQLLFTELGKKVVSNVGKETAEEVVQQFTQDVNNVVINTAGNKTLEVGDKQTYKDTVVGTVVPSMIASLIGGRGSKIVNVGDRQLDLRNYTPAELITELSRIDGGLQVVKQFKEDSYFNSQKQVAQEIENEIATRKKYVDKIPNQETLSTTTVTQVSTLLQLKEQLEARLKTTDDSLKFMVEGQIADANSKIQSLIKNDSVNNTNVVSSGNSEATSNNPTTNYNEVTQPTPQSETIQEQTTVTENQPEQVAPSTQLNGEESSVTAEVSNNTNDSVQNNNKTLENETEQGTQVLPNEEKQSNEGVINAGEVVTDKAVEANWEGGEDTITKAEVDDLISLFGNNEKAQGEDIGDNGISTSGVNIGEEIEQGRQDSPQGISETTNTRGSEGDVEVASESSSNIDNLEKEYNDKTVDELVSLKKELYPNPDIESPMSEEEKLLDKVIAKKYSDINEAIREKQKGKSNVDNYSEPTQNSTTLTQDQEKQNHVIGLKNTYNKLSNAKKNGEEGRNIRNTINRLSQELGFVVGNKDGKIAVTRKNGKNVGKVPVKFDEKKPTEKEIEVAKSHIDNGLLNWNGQSGNPRIDTELSWSDIRKGKSDIENGNFNSIPARRLINEINRQINDLGGFNFIEGRGGITHKTFVSLDEITKTQELYPKGWNSLDLLTDQELNTLYNEQRQSEEEFYSNKSLQDENSTIYEEQPTVQEESRGNDTSQKELNLSDNQIQVSDNVIATTDKITLPDGEDGFKVTITDNEGNALLDKEGFPLEDEFGSKAEVDKFISDKKRGYELSNKRKNNTTPKTETAVLEANSKDGTKVTMKVLGENVSGVIEGEKIRGNDGRLYNPKSSIVSNIKDESGNAIQFNIIGEQGANNIDNSIKASIMAKSFEYAKKLEKAGGDAETIHFATGWHRGNDGKWRFELDYNATQKQPTFTKNTDGNFETTLGELIDYPMLFAAYPQLRDTKVIIANFGNSEADMSATDKVIYLNEKYYNTNSDGKLQSALPLGTLLHEQQHLIQSIEGFSRGTDNRRIANIIINELRGQGREIGSNNERVAVRNYLEKEYGKDWKTKLEGWSANQFRELADTIYTKFAGEVEARNVAFRKSIAESTRKTFSPKHSVDIANEEQVVVKQLASENVTFIPLTLDALNALVERLKKPFAKAFKNLNLVTDWNEFVDKVKKLGNKVDFNIIGKIGANPEQLLLLSKAVKLENSKYTPEEIVFETGWFKGLDGKWRTTTNSDVELNVNDFEVDKEYKLSDLISHEDLFNSYPNFKDISVIFKQTTNEGNASYNGQTNTIAISGNNFKGMEQHLRRLFQHEIQHAIQGVEQFARGSNRAESGRAILDTALAVDFGIEKTDKQNKINDYLKNEYGDNWTENINDQRFIQKASQSIYEILVGEFEASTAEELIGLPYNRSLFALKMLQALGNKGIVVFGSERLDDMQFMHTPNGEVYGAKLPDGTIYLNPNKLNANTAIHEFSHLWEQLMPNTFKKGVELLKQTKTGKDIFNKLKEEGNYSHLTDEQLWNEAMNTHIGEYGEWQHHNPKGKMAEFKQWLKDFFGKIGEVLGIKNVNPDTKLRQFTENVLGDMLGSKPLFAEQDSTNTNTETQFNLVGSKPIPKKDIKAVRDEMVATKDLNKAFEVLKQSNWYKGLKPEKQSEITTANFGAYLIDSAKVYEERNIEASKRKVEKVTEKKDVEIKDIKTSFKEKFQQLKDDYKSKLAEIKKSNKEARQKVRAIQDLRTDAINSVRKLITDKSIRDNITPNEVSLLIGKAEKISTVRDFNKALDEFNDYFLNLVEKADNRVNKEQLSKEKQFERYNELYPEIEDMVNNGKTDSDIINSYSKTSDQEIAEVVVGRVRASKLSEKDATDLVNKSQQEEAEILNKRKPLLTRLKEWKEKIFEKTTDRQYLPKKYLTMIGANNTFNRMINMAGASARAKQSFDKAYSKIFYGLSQNQRKDLDFIIQQKRIIAIDNNREEQGLLPIKHPNGGTKDTAQKWLDSKKNELGNEVFSKLEKRAELYFGEFRGLLDEMKNEGLINQEAYDNMISIDYQPRLFLKHLVDYDGNFSDKDDKNFRLQSTGLSDEIIKSLDDGDEGVLLSNAELLLATAMTSRYKSIMVNRMNHEFITKEFPKAKSRFNAIAPSKVDEYEANIKDNKRAKTEEERFYRYFKELDKKIVFNAKETPHGYRKAYYYDNGVRHDFFMEEKLHERWHDTLNSLIPSNTKGYIRTASGSSIIKTFATGNNPAFAIVNTPRDFVHTILFSDVYSKSATKGAFQLLKDAIESIGEIKRHDKGQETLLTKYIQYGGGMDFLSTQGTLKKDSQIGKAIEGFVSPQVKDVTKKLFNGATLKFLSRYSEVTFRVAVFKRAIDNKVAEARKTNPSVKTIEDLSKEEQGYIYDYAVAQARNLMDFNQGGTLTKDAENIIPYINAATQGTRVMMEQFKRNPQRTVTRMLEVTTGTIGTMVGLSLAAISMFKADDDDRDETSIYLDFLETLSPSQKTNYFNIPISYDKNNGTYKMVSIAKAQGITPLLTLVENTIENTFRFANDKELLTTKTIMGNVGYAFTNNVDPTAMSGIVTGGDGLKSIPETGAKTLARNPLMKAVLTYTTGYDFYFEQPLQDTQNGRIHKFEGTGSNKVEDFYKTLGIKSGLSPVRTKAAIEAFITSPTTNPSVGFLYGGANILSGDKNLKEAAQEFVGFDKNNKSLYKIGGLPIVNRMIRETNPYSRQLNISKNLKESEVFKNALEEGEMMKFISDNIAKKYETIKDLKKNEEVVLHEIENFSKDSNVKKNIIDRINKKVENKDIDGRVWDVAFHDGATNKTKAMLIYGYFGNVNNNDKLKDDLKYARVWSEKIRSEYKKILEEKSKK